MNQVPQTLKGFRDFLPNEERKRQYVIEVMKGVFEKHSFEPIATPALEYQELLLGKYGDEADKLVYKFKDNGERDVALRYDQTVPTARVLATYKDTLPMPFRRYQIQPVWRAENTQKGRYREFTQCDIDIFGSNSELADAEVLSVIYESLKALGFKKFSLLINDRQILFELMQASGIDTSMHLSAIQSIDKLDKKSEEDVKGELAGKTIPEASIQLLFDKLAHTAPSESLKKVIKTAQKLGVPESFLEFRPSLARGLDYYTGTIIEVIVDGYNAGSVGGGGRYDNLIEKLCGTSIPAVGFAFGFDRLIDLMEDQKLFPETTKNRVLVSIFNSDLANKSSELVQQLRDNGITAELFPDQTAKLDKQFKYADKKGLEWLIVLGPDEDANNTVTLKNLKNGHQETIPQNSLVEKILQ